MQAQRPNLQPRLQEFLEFNHVAFLTIELPLANRTEKDRLPDADKRGTRPIQAKGSRHLPHEPQSDSRGDEREEDLRVAGLPRECRRNISERSGEKGQAYVRLSEVGDPQEASAASETATDRGKKAAQNRKLEHDAPETGGTDRTITMPSIQSERFSREPLAIPGVPAPKAFELRAKRLEDGSLSLRVSRRAHGYGEQRDSNRDGHRDDCKTDVASECLCEERNGGIADIRDEEPGREHCVRAYQVCCSDGSFRLAQGGTAEVEETNCAYASVVPPPRRASPGPAPAATTRCFLAAGGAR